MGDQRAAEGWRNAVAEQSPAGVSVWKPVALMLVASSLAYCAGRTGMDRPPVARPMHDELLKALGSLPTDTVFQSENGRVQRRLTVGDENTIFIEEDFDRDGQWDRERMYRDGELVADTAP